MMYSEQTTYQQRPEDSHHVHNFSSSFFFFCVSYAWWSFFCAYLKHRVELTASRDGDNRDEVEELPSENYRIEQFDTVKVSLSLSHSLSALSRDLPQTKEC
jgi:hypothetical protein